MAEITDKTIQDLNKLLQRLADDQGSDKATDTPGRAQTRLGRGGGSLAAEEKALENATEKVKELEQAYKNLGFSIEREYQQKAAQAEETLARVIQRNTQPKLKVSTRSIKSPISK